MGAHDQNVGEGLGRLGLDPKNKRGEQPGRKRYSMARIMSENGANDRKFARAVDLASDGAQPANWTNKAPETKKRALTAWFATKSSATMRTPSPQSHS